jgi:hypothetical protein
MLLEAALMQPTRCVARCARALTHDQCALALVLAGALRSSRLSAAEQL